MRDGAGGGDRDDPEEAGRAGGEAEGPDGEDEGPEASGDGAAEAGGDAAGPGPARRHPADETVRTDALPDAIRCPHCGEEESEQFSSFGSAVSVSQYYCRSCRTVFEAFKWR